MPSTAVPRISLPSSGPEDGVMAKQSLSTKIKFWNLITNMDVYTHTHTHLPKKKTVKVSGPTSPKQATLSYKTL